MPKGQPSDQFLQNAERFAASLKAAQLAYHRDRWRRRGWQLLNAVVVPAVLVPVAMFEIGLSITRPPDMPSLFAMLFAMALSCVTGGVYGGAAAITIFAALTAWQMRHYPLADVRLWIWFTLVLCGYGTILACLYFRAPDPDPWVPKRGLGFFRKPLGVLRRRRHDRVSHLRDSLALEPAAHLVAPRLVMLRALVLLLDTLALTTQDWWGS